MLKMKSKNNEIIIRFPKGFLSKPYIDKFIERLEVEELAERNQMTEEQAWKISEEIKKDWWESNESQILKSIKK
ncbi:MAG: hypothetical protein KAT05_16340 [Spirochaetes bacterium]|nr:hypothetical protein [Spirochaetota bacterium]